MYSKKKNAFGPTFVIPGSRKLVILAELELSPLERTQKRGLTSRTMRGLIEAALTTRV